MKEQIKTLEEENNQIKDSAIQTIIDKELLIEELRHSLQEKEDCFESKIDYLQQMIDFQSDKIKSLENDNNTIT